MMKYKLKYYNTRESGVALVFAIGLLGLMLAVGLAFLGNALLFKKVARNNSSRTQARMLVLSAANRAAASIMVYQQQAISGDDTPDNFNNIYSFGKYDDDGKSSDSGKKITDGLKKKDKSSSKMLLPEDSSLVEKAFAVSYNTDFQRGGTWDGSWVFFYNKKDGNDREIIGRAAWQVVTSSSQILAPVFFRGNVKNIDSKDSNFVARDHRWGREIDEVWLDNAGTPVFDENALGTLGADTRINDFDSLFNYLKDDTAESQAWVKTWLIPDFTEKEDYGTVKDPMPIFPEVYVYQHGKNGKKYQLMRFNISEGDYNGDKWYGRFTTADSDKNSKAAVHKLTSGSIVYSASKEPKKDRDYTEHSGLPFLRFIGNENDGAVSFRKSESGTVDMMAWRKQIAANFNDYCDSDSIPTSDVAAADWIKDFNGTFTEDISSAIPTFTGDEKTPYLYEFGMNFGIVPGSGDVISAVPDGGNSYSLSLKLQAIPLLKLANIYDFDPDSAFTAVDGESDFMRGHVDFGKTEVIFAPKAMTLKNVNFSFEETIGDETYTRTAKVDIKIADVSKLNSNLAADLTLTPGAEVWKNSNGEAKSVGVPFAKDALTNTTGGNPYPFFRSKNHDDKYWQFLTYKLDGLDFSISLNDFRQGGGLPAGITLENFSTTGTQDITNVTQFEAALSSSSNSLALKEQADEVIIDEILLKKVSFKPRRVVLTGKEKDAGKEIGVDFAGYFGEITWNATNDTVLNLGLNAKQERAGVLIGGIKNYDPRQNLYGVDWSVSDIKFAKLINFKAPAEAEVEAVMAVDASGKGLKNGNPGTAFSPDNSADETFDMEEVDEPAFSNGKRLSTAYIRNAPMMSPWEVGVIHRGRRWQTLNIKKAGNPGNSNEFSQDSFKPVFSDSDVDKDWQYAGTKYVDGDGALLEQIKMTDRIDSYGKINVNLIGRNDLDINIVNALFNGIAYNQSMGDFIEKSTRQGSGAFPAVEYGSGVKELSGGADVFASMKSASSLRPFTCRAAYLNFESSGALENAFGKATLAKNDAAREEIIGKTINLLSAETTSPAMVQVVIVAQSIQDSKGVQVKATSETNKGKFNTTDGSAFSGEIEDGTVSLDCELGRFDMLEHSENDDLNVYFDEVTGEVKALVTFVRDPATGRLFINRIDYLSD